jgi:hypothetical protein
LLKKITINYIGNFQVKADNEIPPLQFTSENGIDMKAFSDKILNQYFSSISNIDDTSHNLPERYSLCNDSLSDIFIEEQEVIDIISKQSYWARLHQS